MSRRQPGGGRSPRWPRPWCGGILAPGMPCTRTIAQVSAAQRSMACLGGKGFGGRGSGRQGRGGRGGLGRVEPACRCMARDRQHGGWLLGCGWEAHAAVRRCASLSGHPGALCGFISRTACRPACRPAQAALPWACLLWMPAASHAIAPAPFEHSGPDLLPGLPTLRCLQAGTWTGPPP
jgi:hypothetical protein